MKVAARFKIEDSRYIADKAFYFNRPESMVIWNIKKMKELKAQGKTMVFVTHSMGTVKEFCTRAVWLCDGVVKMDGKPDDVIEEYLKETL